MVQRMMATVSLFALAALLAVPAEAGAAQARTKIRYALGDVVSIDELPLLIAAERAKARGVDVEITSFKNEELATQAVINGQADVGQGTPYAAVQKATVPIRFFFQLSALQFFPVVNKESYKSWKDLDGQEIAVHARGSGTEAIMILMAKNHGIKYKNISYVPGSQVRALALLKGNIKATILDAPNKNLVMKEAPDKFIVLPLGNVKASDEALFATRAFLDKNRAAVRIFLEELIKVNRAINKDPAWIVEERKRLGLLKDLPAKLEGEILPFYKEAVQNGVFPDDGGGESAAKNDLEFYSLSGAIKGENLKVEDFWYLAPLKEALASLK
ncbi:MAG TPA: ABC transporter substrate-binding protein [candidate division Zixibacteria bacterium]|nr:ABC transporter substrate-binding protein [candidate division Zixibacteria bacterium]